ncbi:hypothetical protein ElyMa_001771000 [Elysia marginata]|uniref:Secreted protein n=1 Tax=Elysia marginata TaxID=1093978 RepID=A0AAV4ED24_9GAST|nr:hypothetical protein ElyMa_001771000 [Elysia marginata]
MPRKLSPLAAVPTRAAIAPICLVPLAQRSFRRLDRLSPARCSEFSEIQQLEVSSSLDAHASSPTVKSQQHQLL